MKIELDESIKTWSKYAKIYDPIKCASIDGTDCEPHDRAVVRALNSTYRPNRFVKGRPECTIFVSRLNHETSKDTIKDIFSKYGKVKRFRMVKDIVTGMPQGYAFVEYEEEQAAEEAYRLANRMVVDGNAIFVDFECERLLKKWKPRRLGGGFGGKKESGQLRFGGRDRPFKKPIALELKEQEDRRQRERRKKEEDRRLRDKSRDRHRRRTPPRENGNSSPHRHKANKRGLSPKDKEAHGSPPRKVSRHHSPSKQTDKPSKSSHREKNDTKRMEIYFESQGKKSISSPDRKSERKNSHSSRQETENANEKHNSRGTTKQESASTSKPISNDSSTLSKSARGHSTIKQQQRPRSSPNQNGVYQSSERSIKRSPPRVKNRRRSPFQKTVKRSPQRETYKKRPAIVREKRRSRSPIFRNEEHNSPSREDEKRMYSGRHESPSRKQLKYPLERNNDRRRSPLLLSGQNGDGHNARRLSPSYCRERGYHSPNRRSPLESFNRQYSPQQDLSYSERSHRPRETRESSPPNNRSRQSPQEYFPTKYEDRMHVSRYIENHESRSHPSYHSTYSDLRTSEYLPAQRDFKQYSPKLDFREPPSKGYSNCKESTANVGRRNYVRSEDYSRNFDSLEDSHSFSRDDLAGALYSFRDDHYSYNSLSNNSQNFYPENYYQNVRQHREESSRYEPLLLTDARNFLSSRNDDNSRFTSQKGKLRLDRGGYGQF